MQGKLSTVLSFVFLIAGCGQYDVADKHPQQDTTDLLANVRYAEGFRVSEDEKKSCLTLYDLEREDHPVRCIVCEGEHHVDSDTLWIDREQAKVTTLSTTHLAYFWRLSLLDHVKGTAYASWVKNPEVIDRLDNGSIVDLSADQEIDLERMISIAPDVLISYPYGDDSYDRVADLGVAVIPFSEYLETHPLGRAEWIKAAAWIVGQESRADSIFNAIAEAYQRNSALTKDLEESERPTVFTGSQDQGQWFAPSGNSFIARFIEDAGGRYLFNDNQDKGNIHLDMEVLLMRAMEADFWGKVSYRDSALTYAELEAEDHRFAHLPAFKDHRVFYCNASKTDYFGDAIVEPHIILRDLIAILHPDRLTKHQAVYFQLLPQ